MNIIKGICYLVVALSIALASYAYYHNARYIVEFAPKSGPMTIFKDTWTGDWWVVVDFMYGDKGIDSGE